MDGIVSLIKEFENDFGDVESIGVGMPGCVSNDSSLVKNANSVWLNGKPLKIDLENTLKRKVILENDANCFALSEAVDGAGKGKNVVFGVIIGTIFAASLKTKSLVLFFSIIIFLLGVYLLLLKECNKNKND